MPIYNIVLNSLNQVSGGTNANATYYYDWSVLQQGQYKVTFTYQGGSNTIITTRFATLAVELGQSKVFATSSTTTQAPTSRIIGILSPFIMSSTGTSSLVSSLINQPIYLNAVPTSNTFSVQVSNPDGTPYTDTNVSVNGNYVLILTLELLTKNNQH